MRKMIVPALLALALSSGAAWAQAGGGAGGGGAGGAGGASGSSTPDAKGAGPRTGSDAARNQSGAGAPTGTPGAAAGTTGAPAGTTGSIGDGANSPLTNPTATECMAGWSPASRFSKSDFERSCAR